MLDYYFVEYQYILYQQPGPLLCFLLNSDCGIPSSVLFFFGPQAHSIKVPVAICHSSSVASPALDLWQLAAAYNYPDT